MASETDILNLSPGFWLRADADSPLTDQSGNGRDATETGTVPVQSYAINGKPAFMFDANSANRLDADGAATLFSGDSTPMTFWVVYYYDVDVDTTAATTLFNATGAGPGYFELRKTGTDVINLLQRDTASGVDAATVISNVNLPARKPVALVVNKSATTTTWTSYSWDGTLETLQTGTTSALFNEDVGTLTKLRIGADSGAGNPFWGRIGEFGIIPSSLSAGDESTLVSWLQSQWLEPESVTIQPYRVAGARSVLGSSTNPPRIVCIGDSYASRSDTRLALPILRRLDFGADITAVDTGFANDANDIVTFNSSTTTQSFLRIGSTNNYDVEGGATKWTLPTQLRELSENGTGTYGAGGKMAFITSDFAELDGNNTVGLKTSARIMGRLCYRATDAAADQYARGIRLEDDTTGLIQESDLTADARRFHHLSEGDPDTGERGAPVYGQFNAVYPDFRIDNLGTDNAIDLDLIDTGQTNAAIANTGDFLDLASLTLYAADASNNWIEGVYIQFLNDSSYALAGFAGDEVGDSGTLLKRFSESQLRHWLDATTIDTTQPIIFLATFDNENTDAGQSLREVHGMMDVLETSCSAIGLPDPWLLIVGGPVKGTDSKGMHEGIMAAAKQRERVAFVSLYDIQDDIHMDGSASQDAWLSGNGYEPYTDDVSSTKDGSAINTSLAGVDLISDNTHPTDATSASFFARVAIDEGIHFYDNQTTPLRQGRMRTIGRPLRGRM